MKGIDMMNILKEFFELWIRKRWLVFIDREVRKRDKLNDHLKRQEYLIRCLVKRYNELYPDSSIRIS